MVWENDSSSFSDMKSFKYLCKRSYPTDKTFHLGQEGLKPWTYYTYKVHLLYILSAIYKLSDNSCPHDVEDGLIFLVLTDMYSICKTFSRNVKPKQPKQHLSATTGKPGVVRKHAGLTNEWSLWGLFWLLQLTQYFLCAVFGKL